MNIGRNELRAKYDDTLSKFYEFRSNFLYGTPHKLVFSKNRGAVTSFWDLDPPLLVGMSW